MKSEMKALNSIFFILFLLGVFESTALPEQQFDALHILYNATNGENWTNLCNTGWNFTGYHNPCAEYWYGLTCENDNITSISLANCGLTGTLPGEIVAFQEIYQLYLYENHITGTIPHELSQLSKLSFLDLSDCLLSGPIPSPLPQGIYNVLMSSNHLTGSLPQFSTNAHIITFIFDDNFLNGTVPPLYTLPSVVDLEIDSNFFTGPFPGPWGKNLQELDLSNNLFSGRLVDSNCTCITTSCSLYNFLMSNNLLSGPLTFLSALPRVRTLKIDGNAFTGPLPNIFTRLTRLDTLNISSNQLTGPVDYALLAPELEELVLSSNKLSGHLNLSHITSSRFSNLNLASNHLSGTITFDYFPYLLGIDLSENVFSGPLPSLGNLPFIQQVVLSGNYLTGPMTGLVSPGLHLLNIGDNFVTGTIPAELFNVTFELSGGVMYTLINFLFLQQNFLTGTIPSNIGFAAQLKQIALYQNSLSGTIPSQIANCSLLQTVLLQKNFLSGSPGQAFVRRRNVEFPILQVVDLSRNRFTGTVPIELFQLPRIAYVAIVDGCFEGSIPPEICSAKMLQTLVLEGLHSGSTCRRRIWDLFDSRHDVVYMSRAFGGSIPDCVWNMTSLKTLHMAGNLLEGSLPTKCVNLRVIDLSLSFNRLSGTISKSLIEKSFERIDLSHNKLLGNLDHLGDSHYAHSKIAVSVNRLSGLIPSNIKSYTDVDMLSGNLFDCDSSNDLPSKDPEYDHYVCGSDDFDSALMIWGGLFGAFLTVSCVYYYLYHSSVAIQKDNEVSLLNSITNAWDMLKTNARIVNHWSMAAECVDRKMNPELQAFLRTMRDLRVIVIVLTCAIVTAFFTFYFLAKTRFDMGTHTDQYRWLFTAAYLYSKVAAIVMLVLLFVALVYLVYSIHELDSAHYGIFVVNSSQPAEEEFFSTSEAYTNAMHRKAFLYILTLLLVNCSIVLAAKGTYVYVILWTDATPLAQGLLRFTLSGFDIIWNGLVLSKFISYGRYTLQSKVRIRLHLFMLLFNSVFAPVIASGLTARNCFAELFTGIDSIETEGVYNLCTSADDKGQCISYTGLSLSTTFIPPYTYSYQCGSTVLTSFIPVFILAYTLRAFAQPLLMFCIMYITKSENIPVAITIFPSILWPTRIHKYEFRKIMYPGVIITHILHDIAVMVTYGITSPVCCLVIAVSVCITTLQWHVIIGRYLHIRSTSSKSSSEGSTQRQGDARGSAFDDEHMVSVAPSNVTPSHMALEKTCQGVWQGPMKAVWTIVDTSCIFFALFFIDMGGDHMGGLNAFLKLSLPTLAMVFFLRLYFNYIHAWLEKTFLTRTNTTRPGRDSAIVTDAYAHDRQSGSSQNGHTTWTISPLPKKASFMEDNDDSLDERRWGSNGSSFRDSSL